MLCHNCLTQHENFDVLELLFRPNQLRWSMKLITICTDYGEALFFLRLSVANVLDIWPEQHNGLNKKTRQWQTEDDIGKQLNVNRDCLWLHVLDSDSNLRTSVQASRNRVRHKITVAEFHVSQVIVICCIFCIFIFTFFYFELPHMESVNLKIIVLFE